jgi:CBS domain-containing protein
MRVCDLMQTEVRTVDASTRLDVVEKLMREEVIRHLPVVDGGRVVGMVTQRDLLRSGLSPILRAGPATEQQWLAETRVDQIMTKPVLHAHPEADLAHAVALMVRERIGCLPVIEDERLVGMLSETDCLRYLSRLLQEGTRG